MDKDNWFSGFTDGEGSFTICATGNGFRPTFTITLRADDAIILKKIQKTFGGNTRERAASTRPGRSGQTYTCKPTHHWEISDKKSLMQLIKYFENFPLRSKKAKDFETWKTAVRIYVKWGISDKRLSLLQQAIRDGREFDAVSVSKPYLGPFQQSLFENDIIP